MKKIFILSILVLSGWFMAIENTFSFDQGYCERVGNFQFSSTKFPLNSISYKDCQHKCGLAKDKCYGAAMNGNAYKTDCRDCDVVCNRDCGQNI